MKTNAVKEIISDKNLIAACGLYCGACGSYLKEERILFHFLLPAKLRFPSYLYII